MQTIDFGRSFLRFRIDREVKPAVTLTHDMPTTENNVRIGVECCCELTNRLTGVSSHFVLGAACKTERVGVQRDIWLDPNADFCLIASAKEFLILKSWASDQLSTRMPHEGEVAFLPRQSGDNGDAWEQIELCLRKVTGRCLSSFVEIVECIRGDRPMVARTQYDDGDWTVTIQQPVKTINYSEREGVFQTDTGPLILPNLAPVPSRLVDSFNLAYSAFNSRDWIEFIVKMPISVSPGVQVDHYSLIRRIDEVENQLLEVSETDQLSPSST